jgi:hypothetical protein
LYRKAYALLKTGESKDALECLEKIEDENEEIKLLKIEA